MDSLAVSGLTNNRQQHSVFRQHFGVSTPKPAVVPPPVQSSDDKMSKTLPIVTSAIALASMGVATYALLRKPSSLKNVENKLDDIAREMSENKRTQESVNTAINEVKESVNRVRTEAESKINDLRGHVDNQVGGVRGEMDGVRGEFNNVKGDLEKVKGGVQAAPVINFFNRPVEMNGMKLQLAAPMHGYGVHEGELTNTLRSAAARRIFGAVKPVELPENATIRIPTAEFAGFAKTGGLAIVPKELAANLGAVINNKQKAQILVDTPMYLGQVENCKFFDLVKVGKNEYNYISKSGGKETVMAKVRKVDTMDVDIHNYTDVVSEKVDVFMTDEMRAPVDFADTFAQFDKHTQKAIKEALDAGKDFDTQLVKFTAPKEAGDTPKAEAKFKTVFYRNRKFDMSGPVEDGKIKNIYNNQTTQAGETERFVYFGKFFYEHLLSNHKRMDNPLKADMIVGNDWHTGPIAAMTRLLTPCKKAMGDLDPATADKIENIPIITIMHNFKLQGSADHSQGKLLNVMFDEHAAKIAENAWMPKDSDMPAHLMNGLLSGTHLNPQTMAMSYADDIVFVSRGNFAEASGTMERGGTNYALASMRGRTHQYSDRANLERMGMANGIDPRELPHHATAKGITNGCDRVNNILTPKKARNLETVLGLKPGALVSDEEAILDPFKAHMNNKKVYLAKVCDEVKMAKESNGQNNPLKILNPNETNLAGVDENTPVFAMAGRIVDQKGIDIYAAGYEEFIRSGRYDKSNPPVCWLNGIGDQSYIDAFMASKARIREIDPVAADRMVFSGVFSEAGRYDGAKIMSDFSAMSSWDEPCGLVHKEIGYMSGAISMVNEVGGLRDGLKSFARGADNKGANSIFVRFVDKDTHSLDYALGENAKAWSDAFASATEWFSNRESFAEGIKESYTSRHDWLRGKIQEYVEIGKRHGVITDSVDSNYVI